MQPSKYPLAKPKLPSYDDLEPFIRQIDQSQWYSNFGPLVRQFESKCASHFELEPNHVTVTASGFSAILAAILTVAGRRRDQAGLCLCPAHTFSASISAIEAAGYTPYFVDCDVDTWALNPQTLLDHDKLAETSLVLATAPYGRRPPIKAWESFTSETGIPVAIDGAACFDTLQPEDISARIPIALSFHATKSFGCGEGGAVLLKDQALTFACHRIISNGKFGSQQIQGDHINGKMNEYSAAIGLCQFEFIKQRNESLDALIRAYISQFSELAIPGRLFRHPDLSRAYMLYETDDAHDNACLAQELAKASIEARNWYGPGLHLEPAFEHVEHDPLPNTEAVGRNLIGLPFYDGLTEQDVAEISLSLRSALDCHKPNEGAILLSDHQFNQNTPERQTSQ